MNDDDYNDYRLFAPNGDQGRFHYQTIIAIKRVEALSPPDDYDQGVGSLVESDLKRLRILLNGLYPETVEHLAKTEAAYLADGRFSPEGLKPEPITAEELNFQRLLLVLGMDGSIHRLRMLAHEPFLGRKTDKRHEALALEARLIWEDVHGGKITETEGDRTFVAYLAALIKDSGLSVSPRTLIQKYLR